jgi:5-bromo-4-chloroindolyl phosphate hydrolysis protein
LARECALHIRENSLCDGPIKTRRVHFGSQLSKKKLKVIKKKFNFPSKKIKLIKKKLFPHILACASQTQNTSIMKSVHCIIKKNMFKLFFDDLNFFGGSLVKQLLLAEKVY